MAQIIIAKHRKGATGDVLLTFRGEFTRFENPEEKQLRSSAHTDDGGGEILGSKINGGASNDANISPFEPGEAVGGPLPF
jgi:replicative DNA helicase